MNDAVESSRNSLHVTVIGLHDSIFPSTDRRDDRLHLAAIFLGNCKQPYNVVQINSDALQLQPFSATVSATVAAIVTATTAAIIIPWSTVEPINSFLHSAMRMINITLSTSVIRLILSDNYNFAIPAFSL